MKRIPNFLTIGRIVDAWRGGAVTTEEAEQNIRRLMTPANFLPECEVVRESTSDHKVTRALQIMERLEIKMNALLSGAAISLPVDVNPEVLLDDVKALIDANDVLRAIKLHRDRTGMGLAEAKALVDRYRESKFPPSNQL